MLLQTVIMGHMCCGWLYILSTEGSGLFQNSKLEAHLTLVILDIEEVKSLLVHKNRVK